MSTAWKNKRRIHIARGTATNIINVSGTENKFTDGQPLHIKDKNYLAVANTTSAVDPKNIKPIAVRTIEGWLSDSETDSSFTLSANKQNHYILTGRDNNVYLRTLPNFKLQREVVGNNPIDVLVMDTLSGAQRLLVNDAAILQSKLLRTNEIRDINGNKHLTISAGSTALHQNVTLDNAKTLTSPNIVYKTKLSGNSNTAAELLGTVKLGSSSKAITLDGTTTFNKPLLGGTSNTSIKIGNTSETVEANYLKANTKLTTAAADITGTATIGTLNVTSCASDFNIASGKKLSTGTINSSGNSLTINGTVTIKGTLII